MASAIPPAAWRYWPRSAAPRPRHLRHVAPAGLIFKIGVRQFPPVGVQHREAGVRFFDCPGSREAAGMVRHPAGIAPALSCRSCRPNAPFAELLRLSRLSVLVEWNAERGRAVFGRLAQSKQIASHLLPRRLIWEVFGVYSKSINT